jgi:hypothetical protein
MQAGGLASFSNFGTGSVRSCCRSRREHRRPYHSSRECVIGSNFNGTVLPEGWTISGDWGSETGVLSASPSGCARGLFSVRTSAIDFAGKSGCKVGYYLGD